MAENTQRPDEGSTPTVPPPTAATVPAPTAPAPAAPATGETAVVERTGHEDAIASERHDRDSRVERIRSGPVSIEHVQVQRPKLSAKERRGAIVAGALGLPLVTLGIIVLAAPIAAWYVTTVFKSVVVAFATLFGGEAAGAEVDGAIQQVDPSVLGSVSSWLVIVGLVLALGGLLLSWIVLRRQGVFHPGLVTLTAVPMALGLSALLQAGAGALGGLVFQLGDGGVSSVVANSVFALLLFLVASIVIAVVTGILVWLWMASVFRATVVTASPQD